MKVLSFNCKLMHPFNLIISAATQGGKTHWVERLLETRMIHPWPEKIVYVQAFQSRNTKKL